jgi:hypothetical protein
VSDPNFWNDRCAGSSEAAARRERRVADFVERLTGRRVVRVGLGAGGSEHLPGNAACHGFERGAADLHVERTRFFLEVTAPLTEQVDVGTDLWVDKVENARRHPEREYWIVHRIGQNGAVRVIRLKEAFFRALGRGDFTWPFQPPTSACSRGVPWPTR